MSKENLLLELTKLHRNAQAKYAYFLLAAAASAIGFAMTQSKVEPLNYYQIPLGIAILFWALSFISGLRFIEYSVSAIFKNIEYLDFKNILKSKEEFQNELENKASEIVEFHSQKMKFYGNSQSIYLLLGALSYIVWHIVRMWLISL